MKVVICKDNKTVDYTYKFDFSNNKGVELSVGEKAMIDSATEAYMKAQIFLEEKYREQKKIRNR